jgi:hypothetical protein
MTHNNYESFDEEFRAAQQWISVADRQPTETGIYLTVSIVGSMDAKTVVNTLRGQMTEHHGFRWNEIDWQRVTHWMPLPKPPEVKK